MDNGTPALFRQGLPAGMRLAIFASLSVVLMLVDGKMQTLEAFRESIASYVIRPAEAVTEGTAAEGAKLELQMVPVAARCLDCDKEFPVEDYKFKCPHCGSTAVVMTTGRELRVVSIDMD